MHISWVYLQLCCGNTSQIRTWISVSIILKKWEEVDWRFTYAESCATVVSPSGIEGITASQKYDLNHIHILQVMLQLSCSITCQIWIGHSLDKQHHSSNKKERKNNDKNMTLILCMMFIFHNYESLGKRNRRNWFTNPLLCEEGVSKQRLEANHFIWMSCRDDNVHFAGDMLCRLALDQTRFPQGGNFQ